MIDSIESTAKINVHDVEVLLKVVGILSRIHESLKLPDGVTSAAKALLAGAQDVILVSIGGQSIGEKACP